MKHTLNIHFDGRSNENLIADDIVEQHCRDVVRSFHEGDSDVTYITSHNLVIMAFRILIKENVIDANDIVFWYQDVIVQHSPDGQLKEWPVGMGDVLDHFLDRLLGWKAPAQDDD